METSILDKKVHAFNIFLIYFDLYVKFYANFEDYHIDDFTIEEYYASEDATSYLLNAFPWARHLDIPWREYHLKWKRVLEFFNYKIETVKRKELIGFLRIL